MIYIKKTVLSSVYSQLNSDVLPNQMTYQAWFVPFISQMLLAHHLLIFFCHVFIALHHFTLAASLFLSHNQRRDRSYRLGLFFDAASHPSSIIRLHTFGKVVCIYLFLCLLQRYKFLLVSLAREWIGFVFDSIASISQQRNNTRAFKLVALSELLSVCRTFI